MKIMPNCRDITKQASHYRDQSLPFWKRVGFLIHLRMCAYCRQYVKNLDLTVTTLNKIDREDLTPKNDDTARIVKLIKQQTEERNKQ